MILLMLYWIPFLGICLMLCRLFVYKEHKMRTAIMILMCAGVIYMPKLIGGMSNLFAISFPFSSYLQEIIVSSFYIRLLAYAKRLVMVGIIFLILSLLGQAVGKKIGEKVKSYVHEKRVMDRENSVKNDLLIRKKQERARNTHVVFCPHCNASNILTEKTGMCQFFRSHLEYVEKEKGK